MKYRIGLIAIIMLAASPAMSQEEPVTRLDVGLDASYRTDSLDWNIANDITGTSMPNVASELRWRDLKIWQTRARLDAEQELIVFRGSVALGRVAIGTNEDSDYAGNNRTQEWSRSVNDAGSGDTLDVSGGLGYRWPVTSRISLVPLLGYAWHEQRLTMRKGTQVLSSAATINGTVVTAQPLGPLVGLDSSYKTRWHGPWIGTDVDWKQDKISARLSVRYAWMDYRGDANWNLRTDLQHPVSFRHTARGSGWQVGGRVNMAVAARWNVGLSGDVSRYSTRAGIDTQYMAAGGTGVTRFNKATWNSASVGLDVVYHYR